MFSRRSKQSLPSLCDVDDVAQLETIENSTVLDCIKQRYEHSSYYTYIGDTVIAVNPCQKLPIYSSTQHEIYCNIRDRSSQPAHIFWAADFAHRSLQEGSGHCLVVTGDSGSGKTENTKLIIKHLVHIDHQSSANYSDLISKLEQINRVLELFGNAETSLNDNSSRFGKLVELSYSDTNHIENAKIEGYILEKFRVTEPNEDEKNFHVFYSLFAGMSESSLQELDLEELGDYRILTSFKNREEEHVYKQKYEEMVELFQQIGFEQQTVDQINYMLAAILHLTNVEFDEDPDGMIGFMDIKSSEYISSLCRMLNLDDLDTDDIKKYLLETEVRDGIRLKKLSEAEDARDALARELYSCIFYGIIDVINSILSNDVPKYSKKKTIRILDISGFENLENNNRFEQLLINTVNENLQQFFLKQVFKEEVREFQTEEVSLDSVEFKDNSDVISLLCKNSVGILPLLNDSVSIHPSIDQFLANLEQMHQGNPNFRSGGSYRGRHFGFTVNHYANKVAYDARDFFKKNRDTVSTPLAEIVQRSDNLFIRDYFLLGSYATTSKNRGGRASFRGKISISSNSSDSSRTGKLVGRVTDSFQKSLKRMMDKIQSLQPIFIRCIKPNLNLQPSLFDKELVRSQLDNCGISEIAKVRCNGYPIRIPYKDFVRRYNLIIEDENQKQPTRNLSQTILSNINVFDYELGKSKIFLKMKHRDLLEAKTIELERAKEKIEKDKEVRTRKLTSEMATRQAMLAKEAALASKQIHHDSKVVGLSDGYGKDGSDSGMSSSSASDIYNSSLNTVQSTLSEDSIQKGLMQTVEEGLEEERSEVGDVKGNDPGGGDRDEEKDEERDNKSKSGKPETDASKKAAWETMCITERDSENSHDFELSVRRVVRFIIILLLLVFVAGSCSISKLSMYWMSKTIAKPGFDRSVVFIQLNWCLTVPLAYKWLSSLFKALFATKHYPSKKAIVLLTIIDVCQTAGRCVMVLLVMPHLSPMETTLISLSVCQLPALFNIISEVTSRIKRPSGTDPILTDETKHLPDGLRDLEDIKSPKPSRTKFVGVMLLSLTAMFIQWGAPSVLIVVGNISKLPFLGVASQLRLGGFVCLVCFSITVTWWENFAFGKLPFCGLDLNEVRKTLRRVRMTSYIYSAPLQIIVSGTLIHYILDNEFAASFEYFETSFMNMFFDWDKIAIHFKEFGLMYVQMISTNMCVYCCGIACRLRMQQFGFALPIVLVPIIFTALASVCTPSDPVKWYEIVDVCARDKLPTDIPGWITFGLTIAVYLSYLFVSRHIWFSKAERMAKLEKLFSFGHSDPVFPDVSLALKRRQDEAENKDYKKKQTEFKIPQVYICATMWHEVQQEMLQLLKSLFRLDFDICKRDLANKKFGTNIGDLYTAEIHIIFDDAFQTDEKTKQRVMNGYVEQLVKMMPMACASVSKGSVFLKPVKKITTPYGGRLEWIMPGGTKMEVHLKDKNKIRHKKRWSQIMYMYYLLGHKLLKNFASSDELLREAKNRVSTNSAVRPYSSLLNKLPAAVVEEAANTFVMALDGDVDFGPEAVRLLIDRMKKNRDVAAVCGRIHPIGQGPMVWYQQFEYAVGHWLQKATENVLGCVLCCPGCFSLFRGLSLMDDNVMRMYAIDATEAKHFIQYEQGEDRWLCTLLLQQGYKIDYCAGSDAFTYAPETFNDFYIQRRRWSPSTMANLMDLLGSWKSTIKMNNNISTPFMIYQFVLMASSILAPGTVTFMISGSYAAVLGLNPWQSYLLSTLPVLAYILLCLKAKTETQVAVAAVLSAVYAIVMVIVSVGTVINIVQEEFYTPNVLFLVGLSGIFVVTAMVHPNEMMNLLHGILYYLTVPSTFVFLTVFFLCNLNIVSWGTREAPKKTDDEDEFGLPVVKVQPKSRLRKFIDSIGIPSIFDDLRSFIRQTLGKEADPKKTAANDVESGLTTALNSGQNTPAVKKKVPRKPKVKWVELRDSWKDGDSIKDGTDGELVEKETLFWQKLITMFLLPIKENKDRQEQIATDLKSIRNNVVFAYFLLNLMFTLVILQINLKQDLLKDSFFIAGKYEPVSVLFLSVFALLIVTQFVSMLIHRWGTFLLLMSSTDITWCKTNSMDDTATALNQIEEMQKGQQDVLYLDDSDSDADPFDGVEVDYSDDDDMAGDQGEQNISQYERIVEKEHNRRRKSLAAIQLVNPPQNSAWMANSSRNNKSVAVRNLYRRSSVVQGFDPNEQYKPPETINTRGKYNRYTSKQHYNPPPTLNNYQRRYVPNQRLPYAPNNDLMTQGIPECDYD